MRGMKIGAEYPIYEGRNTARPVRRQAGGHRPRQPGVDRADLVLAPALRVIFDKGYVAVEDLNSLNGTWVNGVRIPAGQSKPLRHGDVVQIGTVQMKLLFG